MAHETTLPRNRKGWAPFATIAAALFAISIVAGLPAITRTISPALLVAGVLASAGPLVAVFVGMLRDLGEVERRIVSGALALSFIATISAMFAYPFLEALGLPPLRPQTVAFVLVASFAFGVERSSRRYQ